MRYRSDGQKCIEGLFGVLLIIALSVGAFFLLSHKCVKGEYVTSRVPGYMETTYIKTDNMLIPISNWIPEHDVTRWRCECGKFGFPR